MRISEEFQLSLSQADLDFVDVNSAFDVKLFIDPCWVHIEKGPWFKQASETITGFFQHIIDLYQNNKVSEAQALFDSGHEPNETCFGLSKSKPRGNGASKALLSEVFKQVVTDKMIEKGLVKRLEDLHVLVKNFGEDRLSDLVTNIIRKHLMDFTKEQCAKHNIPLGDEKVDIGPCWNNQTKRWETCRDYPLLVRSESKSILLVPKKIAVKTYRYSAGQYCTYQVLEKRVKDHLAEETHLVRIDFDKNGKKTKSVKKTDIRTTEIKKSGKSIKEYVFEISKNVPALMDQFRASIQGKLLSKTHTNRLTDQEFMELVEKSAS